MPSSVNLFENCYFTCSLLKATISRKLYLPTGMFILLIVSAYFGFRDVPIALTLLQTLMSATVLGSLFKHVTLSNGLDTLQNCWVDLFQHSDIEDNTLKYQASIYRNWLNYETLLSTFSADISEETFNKLNPQLTKDWEVLKLRYNIS